MTVELFDPVSDYALLSSIASGNSKDQSCVGFYILAIVTMNSAVFWNMTPYSPVEHHEPFNWTYCLHLQDRRARQADNQREGNSNQSILLVAYSSSLIIEAVSSTETSITYRTQLSHRIMTSLRSRLIKPLRYLVCRFCFHRLYPFIVQVFFCYHTNIAFCYFCLFLKSLLLSFPSILYHATALMKAVSAMSNPFVNARYPGPHRISLCVQLW